jgi:hypothetical protein
MRLLVIATLVCTGGSAAWALPTMVRLGYPNCLSCHVAPQGAGLLNSYGRGIDQAQSFKGGEYAPSENRVAQILAGGARIDQDVRTMLSTQVATVNGNLWGNVSRGRFFYRNVTTLGKGFRISGIVDGETNPIIRKAKPYDPVKQPGSVMVTSLMLQYRPKEGMEFGVGRDTLPQGLIIPDQTTYIKARNRLGYYDTPTQAKAFFWGKRYMISPFVFAPSYREPLAAREHGAGAMAEMDLGHDGKRIVGTNTLYGSERLGNRTMTGVYTRLGFGSWGVLAEHDFTRRSLVPDLKSAKFNQHASYVQGFYYPREWLLTGLIAERLTVQNPYPEHLWQFKGEIASRMSSNWNLSFRGGAQRDFRTGAWSPIFSVQLALKTVR